MLMRSRMRSRMHMRMSVLTCFTTRLSIHHEGGGGEKGPCRG